MKHFFDEEKIKHLEFIQNIITRMNTNSFQIKSWSITINAALLALYASNSNEKYMLIAIAPTLVFWFLDSYYLQQERKFRGVYNDVAGLVDISKRTYIRKFEMPIHKYKLKPFRYIDVFFSKTILIFYLTQVMLLFVGWLILSKKGVDLWQRGKCFIVSIMEMM
jgi:hypothetical protein